MELGHPVSAQRSSGGNGLSSIWYCQGRALTKKSATKSLVWHEEEDRMNEVDRIQRSGVNVAPGEQQVGTKGRVAPEKIIATAPQLFDRLYCASKRLETAGAAIPVTASQRKAFRELNELRNRFTHFRPSGWLIEQEFGKQVIAEVLTVFESMSDDLWTFRNMREEDRLDLNSRVLEIRRILRNI